MGATESATPFFPGLSVTARRCYESDEDTADCTMFCLCSDGVEYAIKDRKKHPAHPHIELFCTRLAEEVGLASPPCKVVALLSNELAFGSRIESGHNPENWWLRSKAGEFDFASVAPIISRILAFDLFIHNDDRHLHNYIVRKQKQHTAIMSFDYSRAWLWHGFPPPPLPMDSLCNTIYWHRYLKQEFGEFVDLDEVDSVLQAIRVIPVSRVQEIISEHPSGWLTAVQKWAITEWWDSPKRLTRINQIEKGMADGTFL